MVYTVILNGHSYDLPAKTVSVWDALDQVLKLDSRKDLSLAQKYRKMLEFVAYLIGEDSISEVFGSADLDAIDTNEIALVVLKIKDAYEKPLRDYTLEQNMEQFNSLPIEKIKAVNQAFESAERAQFLKTGRYARSDNQGPAKYDNC